MKIRFLFLPVSFVTLCVVLGTTATSQICIVDLRQVTGRAQCSPGCESCTFRLFSGTFEGTGPIQCLEAVPCLVEAIHASNFAFKETEVRAETASKLTILTEGDGGSIWKSANIYAPGNGGDFHWESHTIAAVRATNFYATDSGVVSFVFRSEDNAVGPAFHSMDVFAATARKLTIWLESGTEFGVELSRIQCPEYDSQSVWPTCVWKSDGSPVDSGASIAVKFITEKGTPRDVYFDCLNLDACKRIWVYCNGEEENCEMLYSGSNWYCHGSCECHVPTTTTVTPTTTSETPTSTTETPTTTVTTRLINNSLTKFNDSKHSKKEPDWDKTPSTFRIALFVACALMCCLLGVFCSKGWSYVRRRRKRALEKTTEKESVVLNQAPEGEGPETAETGARNVEEMGEDSEELVFR